MQHAEHVAARHRVTERRRFGSEQLVELDGVDLAALDQRPRVRIRIPAVDGADEVDRQPVLAFVGVERIEGTRQDHAPEVPEDGRERCGLHRRAPYDVRQRRAHLVHAVTNREPSHMATTRRPDHFVVDGSNIATEGRSEPSLEQLNDAVLAFMEDHPGAVITVVVDATFGHRIAKKEVKAFDEAVANNELVTPPAGAVGRGYVFVLTIAHKAGAGRRRTTRSRSSTVTTTGCSTMVV